VQNRFWEPKPVEELYDVQADPHNVRNLANDPEYAQVLKRMREALRQWVRDNRDAGFLPEGWMLDQSRNRTAYKLTHSPDYPAEAIIETAELASERRAENLPTLVARLRQPHPAVRYWAATGCSILGERAGEAVPVLRKLLRDPAADVRIATADALVRLGDAEQALQVLVREMSSKNPRVQLRAINALDALGERAKPVLKQIMAFPKWRSATDNYVHRAFYHLVEKLKPGWGNYIVW